MEQSGELLKIITPYRPGPGHFAKVRTKLKNGSYLVGQWFYCRDLWHTESRSVRLFLYSHAAGRSRAVIAFIRRFEEIVGADPSQFGPTQRKTITWINQSGWWRTSMRRSLFSLLLRVAPRYVPQDDNFYDALFSIEMTRQTRPAIERFLAGHTSYQGRIRGWYAQFARKKPLSDADLNKLLV